MRYVFRRKRKTWKISNRRTKKTTKAEKRKNKKKKKTETERIEEIAMEILNKQRIKKLANHWNIELRKESKGFILNTATNISNGKNTKVETINLTFKNDELWWMNLTVIITFWNNIF